MKLQIAAGELLKALTIVNRARIARTTLPILNGVLMEIKADELVLSRTNLILSIKTTIEIDRNRYAVDRIVAPADPLTQLLSKLPSDHEIIIESLANQLTITSKYGKYKFATMSPDDLPRIRSHKTDGEFALNPQKFAADIKRAAFCVSDDVSRPAVNGLYWSDAKMVATNSHIFSWNQCDEVRGIPAQGVIVPVDVLTAVAEIASGSEEFVVTIKDKQISFRVDNTEVVSNLLEGPYPDVGSIIPRAADTVAVVDRQSLIEAIGRLGIVVDDFTHMLTFKFDLHEVCLSSAHADSGKTGMEVVACELSGEKIKIAFNLHYISSILRHIDTQKVQIEMIECKSAAIFKPVNVTEYFYLVMPLRMENK